MTTNQTTSRRDRYAEGFAALQACEALEADRFTSSNGFGRWIPEELVSGRESFPATDAEIDALCDRLFSAAIGR